MRRRGVPMRGALLAVCVIFTLFGFAQASTVIAGSAAGDSVMPVSLSVSPTSITPDETGNAVLTFSILHGYNTLQNVVIKSEGGQVVLSQEAIYANSWTNAAVVSIPASAVSAGRITFTLQTSMGSASATCVVIGNGPVTTPTPTPRINPGTSRPMPEVSFQRTASATEVERGKTVTLSYTVTNRSFIELTHVAVLDELVGTISEIGVLGPLETRTFNLPYVVQGTALSRPRLIYAYEGVSEIVSQTLESMTLRVKEAQAGDARVSISANKLNAQPGESVTLTISIQNTGQTTLNQVKFRENTLGEIGAASEVGVGQRFTFTKEFTPKAAATVVVVASWPENGVTRQVNSNVLQVKLAAGATEASATVSPEPSATLSAKPTQTAGATPGAEETEPTEAGGLTLEAAADAPDAQGKVHVSLRLGNTGAEAVKALTLVEAWAGAIDLAGEDTLEAGATRTVDAEVQLTQTRTLEFMLSGTRADGEPVEAGAQVHVEVVFPETTPTQGPTEAPTGTPEPRAAQAESGASSTGLMLALCGGTLTVGAGIWLLVYLGREKERKRSMQRLEREIASIDDLEYSAPEPMPMPIMTAQPVWEEPMMDTEPLMHTTQEDLQGSRNSGTIRPVFTVPPAPVPPQGKTPVSPLHMGRKGHGQMVTGEDDELPPLGED